MKGKKNNVIAVIGDGAITGGMAYEAMNHAGFLDSNMIIILNDNQQVWRAGRQAGRDTRQGRVRTCLLHACGLRITALALAMHRRSLHRWCCMRAAGEHTLVWRPCSREHCCLTLCCAAPCAAALRAAPQVSLPTQYNNRNQDPVGALSSALARLQANRPLRELREVAKGLTKQLPQPIQVRARAG